jgi:hypothetical protein
MVEVVGVFSNFSCFPDYAGMVSADAGYDFCSVKVNVVFTYCRIFSYYLSLVPESGFCNVVLRPGGDVMANLANKHHITGA